MLETALAFDHKGDTLYWHEPHGRTGGSIPDSDQFWDFLWENRRRGGTGLLAGVAHTHPWRGPAGPSNIDLTTFDAIEKGLGQRLVWPVVTFTDILYVFWSEEAQGYVGTRPGDPLFHFPTLGGLEELRERSKNSTTGG